ncbi:hypothetical protein DE146DRAFT_171218 [Phaeosphaeria sp. MPI-PUGE-AT-0046c]|nr:hypothetical protein DE146DRAFT_171218 [Phaeosphaeria sp. MPI-PUGE-AT-0046c]
MRISILLASCISALAAAELLREPPGEEEFRSILQFNDQVLVSFTSRSLASLAPFNDLFRKTVKNASIPFVTLDCDQAASLCASYDINSYPTLRYYDRLQDGSTVFTRYRGPRTSKALLSFVKKRELPVLTQLERGDMNFRRIDDVVFIAMLDPADKHHLDIFTTIAQKHHFGYVFGYTTDLTIAEKEKVQAPSVICYRNNEGDNIILGGAFTEHDAENFVVASRDTFIKEFKEKHVEDFMQRDKLTVYIFTRTPEVSRTMRHRLLELAMQVRQVVTFAIVDVRRYPDMPRNFGTEMSGEVVLVVHAPMNDDVFFYKKGKKIEKQVVEEMLITILHGKASQGQLFGEEADDVELETREEDGGEDEVRKEEGAEGEMRTGEGAGDEVQQEDGAEDEAQKEHDEL